MIAAKRMVKLLEMLDREPDLGIPSGTLFLPPPTLALKGYGWAPRTWLSKQAHAYPLMRPQRLAGSMMKQGFLVEFPGLVLYCSNVPPEHEKFWIPVQQGLHKWYTVAADKGGKSESFKEFWENQVCHKIGTLCYPFHHESQGEMGGWHLGANKGPAHQRGGAVGEDFVQGMGPP